MSIPGERFLGFRFPAVAGPGTLSPVRVRETRDSFEMEWPRWLAGAGAGWGVALVVAATCAGLFVPLVSGSSDWNPLRSAAEQVNYYQVAKNFNRAGFMPTVFLHDLSTASSPAFHPVVYTHMPPGPEILTALLMRVVGESYVGIRCFFGAVFFAGLASYLGFARLVLRRLGLGGAGFTLLFLNPFAMLQAADHPAYSAFPLLAFLPLLLLDRHYRTGRRLPLYGALCLVLLSSVYLVYPNLLLLAAGWIGLALARSIRFDRKHLRLFLGAALLGVGLHALQSVLFLGPALFLEETTLALSNRVLGEPTRTGLRAFYRAIDVVHHGALPLEPLAIGTALLSTLHIIDEDRTSWRIGSGALTAGLLGLFLAWRASRLRRSRREGGALGPTGTPGSSPAAPRALPALGVWAAAAIIPIFVFPAYSATQGLSVASEFFVALAEVTAYAAMAVWWVRIRPPLTQPGPGSQFRFPARAGVALALLAAVAAGGYGTVERWLERVRATHFELVEPDPLPDGLRELGRRLRDTVVMTDAYPTLVGFFTNEAVIGGCGPAVLGADGSVDPLACHLPMVRGFGRGPTVTPTHFVLFREQRRTGFFGCGEACMRDFYVDMRARHPVVYENALYTVFDLTRSRASAGGATS